MTPSSLADLYYSPDGIWVIGPSFTSVGVQGNTELVGRCPNHNGPWQSYISLTFDTFEPAPSIRVECHTSPAPTAAPSCPAVAVPGCCDVMTVTGSSYVTAAHGRYLRSGTSMVTGFPQ